MSDPPNPDRYRFGRFELDVEQRTLRRNSAEVPLQDLPWRLLVALLERAPELVTRDQLRQELWPPDTHLDVDASLNTAVARVRDALGDPAGDPQYVATVPRQGYRLIAPVERLVEPAPQAGDRWRWSGGPVGVAALVAVALIVTLAGLALWAASRAVSPAPDLAAAESSLRVVREHLLIGRHHADQRSRDGLEKAIASYQSAAALDPHSAQAYSGLAAAYALLGIYDYRRPREVFGPAETMARRALELDPMLAEAHLSMALVAAIRHWDWATAGAELERALELAPTSAQVLYWQGAFLAALGRHDQAIESTERALRLEPTSPVINAALAWRLFQARRGDEAIVQAHRALELDPDSFDAWDNLKWIHLTLGHEEEAATAWARAEEIAAGEGAEVEQRYREQGLEGLHRQSIASQLERWEKGRYQSPYDLVLEYTALGDLEPALLWLERSFGERETDLIDLAVDPRLDPLRGEARFQELLVEIGRPGSSEESQDEGEDYPRG